MTGIDDTGASSGFRTTGCARSCESTGGSLPAGEAASLRAPPLARSARRPPAGRPPARRDAAPLRERDRHRGAGAVDRLRLVSPVARNRERTGGTVVAPIARIVRRARQDAESGHRLGGHASRSGAGGRAPPSRRRHLLSPGDLDRLARVPDLDALEARRRRRGPPSRQTGWRLPGPPSFSRGLSTRAFRRTCRKKSPWRPSTSPARRRPCSLRARPGRPVLVIGTGKAGLLCLAAAREAVGPRRQGHRRGALRMRPPSAREAWVSPTRSSRLRRPRSRRDVVGDRGGDGRPARRSRRECGERIGNGGRASSAPATRAPCSSSGWPRPSRPRRSAPKAWRVPTTLLIGNGYVPGHDRDRPRPSAKAPALAGRVFASLAGMAGP